MELQGWLYRGQKSNENARVSPELDQSFQKGRLK